MIDGATEYRDPWRGLRILVPRGWQVRRAGAGIFLHDEAATQAVVVQPRPGEREPAGLAQDLLAWLRRFDPQAHLWVRSRAGGAAQFATARARLGAGEESVGVFALQAGEGSGLISGFMAPAWYYDAASRMAAGALATLASIPLQPRQPWLEPSQGACTAVVPEGWSAEAVLRRANASGLTQANLEVRADEATLVTASAEGKLFVEPGLQAAIRGRLAGGLTGRSRFVDAAGYAERHLLPTLCRRAAEVRIDAVIPRPDLIPPAVAREAASAGIDPKEVLQAQPSAAQVVFSLTLDGRRLRLVSHVLTMRVPPPLARGLPLWLAVTPHAYRAPIEELAAREPVLEGVALSFGEDPAWRAGEQARVAAQLGRQAREAAGTPDGDALLAEAERLLDGWSDKPLAIHERPFIPAGPEPADSSLYDQAPWR